MDKRAQITVTGRIQGVSFRQTVDELAYGLGLKGTVENLEDGSVGIICEGPKPAIEELLRRIKTGMEYPIIVEDATFHWTRAKGDFHHFTIIRKPGIDTELNPKLDLGVLFIRNMHRDLSGKSNATMEAVKSVGSDIKTLDGDIKTMDSNIGGHFEKLDHKYDRFGNTLSGAARDIRGMRGDIGHVRSDMHSLASPRRRRKA